MDRAIEEGIYENVDRYISEDGLVTFLLYLDPTWYQSGGLDTYHDYIRLTVQSRTWSSVPSPGGPHQSIPVE